MVKIMKTKSGLDVKILTMSRKGEFPIVGLIVFEGIEGLGTWTETGAFCTSTPSGFDLVMSNPFSDFKIDDKVLVWDHESDTCKSKRYFAGVDPLTGRPTTFSSGATSWSNEHSVISWNFCVKFEGN